MQLSKNHFLTSCTIILIVLLTVNTTTAQETINVQLKVFDVKLNALPNLEVIIDDLEPINTGKDGVVFLPIPQTSLPPLKIVLSNSGLEAESWNYSKGTLEVIVREKTHKRVIISLINKGGSDPASGIEVHLNQTDIAPLTSDQNGNLSFELYNSVSILADGFFDIPGFQITSKRLEENGGILEIENMIDNKPTQNKALASPAAINTRTIMVETPDKDQNEQLVLNNLELSDLDSINSLTILFSLIKRLDFDQLDSTSKKNLDDKFFELSRSHSFSSLITKPTLELISDTSIINDDLLLLIEEIQYEGELLSIFRQDFETAASQIKLKLEDGGENLSIDERRLVFQLILNLKELLKKNGEKFYKNSTYYNSEIETLQQQLSSILELEDLLTKSEEANRKSREQLIYTSLALAALIGLILLLVFLVRLFISQRNELSQANDEIEKINDNLESLVAEKTKSLELLNEELDTFLYRSSHNLRRPLTSLRGLANVAELSLNEEGIKLFEKVSATSSEMEKMVDKLSMMNYINQPADYDIINFKKIIERIKEKYAEQITEGNILLECYCQDKIDYKSYPLVIELIIQNLLENAILYSRFTSSNQPNVTISMQLDQEHKHLHISIIDNGCGIEEDVQSKIWDMFFVGNVASKGNGLGLYITKKAVKSLSGTISLESKSGLHCTVNIKLPVKQNLVNA